MHMHMAYAGLPGDPMGIPRIYLAHCLAKCGEVCVGDVILANLIDLFEGERCVRVRRGGFAEGDAPSFFEFEGECFPASSSGVVHAILDGKSDGVNDCIVRERGVHVFDVCAVRHVTCVWSVRVFEVLLETFQCCGHVFACPECERAHLALSEHETQSTRCNVECFSSVGGGSRTRSGVIC